MAAGGSDRGQVRSVREQVRVLQRVLLYMCRLECCPRVGEHASVLRRRIKELSRGGHDAQALYIGSRFFSLLDAALTEPDRHLAGDWLAAAKHAERCGL